MGSVGVRGWFAFLFSCEVYVVCLLVRGFLGGQSTLGRGEAFAMGYNPTRTHHPTPSSRTGLPACPEADESDVDPPSSTMELATEPLGRLWASAGRLEALSYECQGASRRSSTTWSRFSSGVLRGRSLSPSAGSEPVRARSSSGLLSRLAEPFVTPGTYRATFYLKIERDRNGVFTP